MIPFPHAIWERRNPMTRELVETVYYYKLYPEYLAAISKLGW
jgi:hypothetical protein